MQIIFFVSLPGERHEDHVPLAIFTDPFLMAKNVVEYVRNITGCSLEDIKFIPENMHVSHVYYGEDLYCTIRKVPANVMCPPILST